MVRRTSASSLMPRMIGAWFSTSIQPRDFSASSARRVRGCHAAAAVRGASESPSAVGEQELVRVVEVHDQPEADVGVGLVEGVEHRQEGRVEAVGVERQLLGAERIDLDAGLGQRGQPGAILALRAPSGRRRRAGSRAACRARLGMHAAVGPRRPVVPPDVGGHLGSRASPLRATVPSARSTALPAMSSSR
jgi:hypothetical protein